MTLYTLRGIESTVGDFRLRLEDCALAPGGTYSVVGPNGSGKTTFLNLLAFTHVPDRGDVQFRGTTVNYADREALLVLRRQIGFLMQNPYLFNMSVRDNIEYGLKVRHRPADEIRRRVDAIMERFQLVGIARRNAHQLSGGETQLVALARTFALDCDVVLLDEPTANVDQGHVRTVENTIRELCREKGTTVILTTHSQDQACRMSRRLLSIVHGGIRGVAYENVFDGTIVDESEGARTLRLGEGLSIAIADGAPGQRVTVVIDPKDILLSSNRLSSSALNAFEGDIDKVEQADGGLRVFVNVGVPLCALVTRKSFHEMNLNIGKPVWVTFKANAVKVL